MVNIAILVGNVGGDPSLRTMPDGGRVANFSLATSESWKDSSGARREKTEWHKVVVFNNLVDVVEKYVTKGKKLFIQGSIKTRKFTDSAGVEKYVTEIVIRGFGDTLKILDSKSDSHDGSYPREFSNEDASVAAAKPPALEDADEDDAIPF